MITSILTGVASSLVASSAFLFVLWKLRPDIKLSPYIADQTTADGPMYAFKIINRSWFPAIHLEFELTLISPKAVPNGVVLRNTLIPLTKSKIFEIGRYYKKDKNANYALRIGTKVDLSDLCKNNSEYLFLTVSVQHSLSGFSRVFTKYYYPQSDIKEGHHEFGPGLDVR